MKTECTEDQNIADNVFSSFQEGASAAEEAGAELYQLALKTGKRGKPRILKHPEHGSQWPIGEWPADETASGEYELTAPVANSAETYRATIVHVCKPLAPPAPATAHSEMIDMARETRASYRALQSSLKDAWDEIKRLTDENTRLRMLLCTTKEQAAVDSNLHPLAMAALEAAKQPDLVKGAFKLIGQFLSKQSATDTASPGE